MKTTLVHDLPTRYFHWIFVGLFVTAFFIAKVIDDDSALYPYHMMFGFMMAFAVLLRIIWGLVGSRYARFSSFDLHPKKLIEYFRGMMTSQTHRQLGHNAASSWSALAMMFCALGLAFTGYQMANHNNKEFFEDVHELFANAFVIVAIAHVAGIIIHTLIHKEMIGLSMVTGHKDVVENQVGIEKSHGLVGVVFLVCMVLFSGMILKNYDTSHRSLQLFGTTLQLGEDETASDGSGEDRD